MRVINVSEGPVYLDDISIVLPYTQHHTPVEILDIKALKSRALKFGLASGHIVRAEEANTPEKIQEAILKFRERVQADQQVVSKSEQLKSMFVTDKKPTEQTIRPMTTVSVAESKKIFQDTGEINAVWTGPVFDAGGYARMNRKFMMGLSDRGVKVKYQESRSIDDMDQATRQRIQALAATRVPDDAIKIYGQTAPVVYDWSRYKFLFTMMETKTLHPDYVERCNFADELVVPSKWCKQVFEESGVKKPISVVPLGVDTSIYRPDAEPIGFSKNLKPFIFLSVFGWSMRKGYDVLLRAYLEEFTSDEPVTLLISSRYYGSTDECKKDHIRNEVARISSTVSNPKKPHIVLFGDVLSDEMMPRMFAAASCYVLISRGEGFGLPYAEAGACNMPVIASRYSGQTDFLDDDNSYLVDVDAFRSAENELAWISYFYQNAEFPVFGKAAIEQTRHHMRHVFENYDEAQVKSQKLHERIVKEYSWDVCIDKMHEKLKDTYRSI